MPRLIDADALMETLKIMRDKNKAEQDNSIETSLIVIGIQEAYCSAIEAVQDAPTIDDLEKRNEPIKPNTILTTGAGIGLSHCPKCGESIDEYHHPSFCGACGQAVKWK